MSYMDFWCPTCAALPGELCRTETGLHAEVPHKPRRSSNATSPPVTHTEWALAERARRRYPTPESRAAAEQKRAIVTLTEAADFLDDGFHERTVDELRSIASDLATLDAPVEQSPG